MVFLCRGVGVVMVVGRLFLICVCLPVLYLFFVFFLNLGVGSVVFVIFFWSVWWD